MERLETILANLRRRDNIREFITGLEDSECWPYPNGESHPIPATFEDAYGHYLEEVELRSDKLRELLELFLINVVRDHPLAATKRTGTQPELADVSIELCPEEGPGAYAVSYEIVDRTERLSAPALNLRDVATIRSAFIHRHEWVVNKLHSVNNDRSEAFDRLFPYYSPVEALSERSEHENEVPLSEEEDYDAMPDYSDHEDGSEQDEDDAILEPELVIVRPYVGSARGSSPVQVGEITTTPLGCAPAQGPSAMSVSTVPYSDMSNAQRIHARGTFQSLDDIKDFSARKSVELMVAVLGRSIDDCMEALARNRGNETMALAWLDELSSDGPLPEISSREKTSNSQTSRPIFHYREPFPLPRDPTEASNTASIGRNVHRGPASRKRARETSVEL